MSRYTSEEEQTIVEFCGDCTHLTSRVKAVRCEIFNDPFPLWGKGKCWARPHTPYTPTREEIMDCWKEEVRRPHKPGGGEKQDRTHKLFPKERMKDNRYKPPWTGFIDV